MYHCTWLLSFLKIMVAVSGMHKNVDSIPQHHKKMNMATIRKGFLAVL
jgi:hypothetical protein